MTSSGSLQALAIAPVVHVLTDLANGITPFLNLIVSRSRNVVSYNTDNTVATKNSPEHMAQGGVTTSHMAGDAP
jgi:hypothetical protein